MKKLLKNNIVGLVILLIWAIIAVNSWPLAPAFMLCMVLHDMTGATVIPEIISLYLPAVIAIFLFIALSEKMIRDIKYFIYGIPIQFILCVIIAWIDPRDWTFKIFYTIGLFLIQGIGVFLHRFREKQQRQLEQMPKKPHPHRKRKQVSTGTLWGLLALDIIGWTIFCGVFLIIHSLL